MAPNAGFTCKLLPVDDHGGSSLRVVVSSKSAHVATAVWRRCTLTSALCMHSITDVINSFTVVSLAKARRRSRCPLMPNAGCNHVVLSVEDPGVSHNGMLHVGSSQGLWRLMTDPVCMMLLVCAPSHVYTANLCFKVAT